MKLLITGANGFLGQNLAEALQTAGNHELVLTDVGTDRAVLARAAADCEFVFHLAGANRPKDEAEFMRGNRDALADTLGLLERAGNRAPVLLSSSTQAEKDNPYGKSKRAAEELLLEYGKRTGIPVYAFRFPNIFGKWSRPNYNSAVATFCYNIARGLPIAVNGDDTKLSLIYVDDAVTSMIAALDGTTEKDGDYCKASPAYETTLGEVVGLIRSFRTSRETLFLPQLPEGLPRKLYATYTSFLPENAFSYALNQQSDARGSFTEFVKTEAYGQVSVNTSRPGVVKGNHYHRIKTEKFLVVSGEAVIRFRRVNGDVVLEYPVSGKKPEVVDIPAGYAHSIENVGSGDLVTVMWASEPFDPARPDTYAMEV